MRCETESAIGKRSRVWVGWDLRCFAVMGVLCLIGLCYWIGRWLDFTVYALFYETSVIMLSSSEKLKLLVVIGTTGVGKSRLGVDIARAIARSKTALGFSGAEIINADAVQMYRGLDIATAKLRPDEMEGVVHHMLGVVDQKDAKSVFDFRNEARELVRDINARGKLPILLGGTLYYIQSLLWPSLRDDGGALSAESMAVGDEKKRAVKRKLDAMEENGTMYEELRRVDACSADRLHPNNTRKVRTSLDIFYETGEKQSDVIRTQHASGSLTELQYNCRIVWLKCAAPQLDLRLRKRVDEMMSAGLLAEAESFISTHGIIGGIKEGVETGSETPERGIFQSIGYKEFMPYLTLDDAEKNLPAGKRTLESCVESLKLHHAKYAKSQTKWIKNRVVTRNAPVYGIDTTHAATDRETWNRQVTAPAMDVLRCWDDPDEQTFALAIRENIEDRSRFNIAFSENDKDAGIQRCDVCDRYIPGSQWAEHIGSRKHKRRAAGIRRRQARANALERTAKKEV